MWSKLDLEVGVTNSVERAGRSPYQSIKILTCVCLCVCVCVCEWRKWDVRGAGLDYSDARPSYFNLFTEPRTPRRMFENIGPGHGLESSMQSGSSSRSGRNRASSSWSGRNRGVAVEADAIGRAAGGGGNGEQQWKRMPQSAPGAAAEADASGEQQLKRTQAASSSWSGRKRRAAAEADAIGEKQLFRELSGAGLRTVGEQGGSSWASEASEATCID